MDQPEPDHDCSLCPRLRKYILQQRAAHPDWHNGPVHSFGDTGASLLITGLAPGLKGANRTGRPFTGDFAGGLLYSTLDKYGFSQGTFMARSDDGLVLNNCMITNAVRCVPPENRPATTEIRTCNKFLKRRLASLPRLKVVLALGKIAHDAMLMALGKVRAHHKFAHAACHRFETFTLINSYHCSRYNTNTGRLSEAMFHDVFDLIRDELEKR